MRTARPRRAPSPRTRRSSGTPCPRSSGSGCAAASSRCSPAPTGEARQTTSLAPRLRSCHRPALCPWGIGGHRTLQDRHVEHESLWGGRALRHSKARPFPPQTKGHAPRPPAVPTARPPTRRKSSPRSGPPAPPHHTLTQPPASAAAVASAAGCCCSSRRAAPAPPGGRRPQRPPARTTPPAHLSQLPGQVQRVDKVQVRRACAHGTCVRVASTPGTPSVCAGLLAAGAATRFRTASATGSALGSAALTSQAQFELQDGRQDAAKDDDRAHCIHMTCACACEEREGEGACSTPPQRALAPCCPTRRVPRAPSGWRRRRCHTSAPPAPRALTARSPCRPLVATRRSAPAAGGGGHAPKQA